MVESRLIISGGRGYSDNTAALRLLVDQDGSEYLHIEHLFKKTWVEHMRIPADDVILVLWPRVLKHIETVLENDWMCCKNER